VDLELGDVVSADEHLNPQQFYHGTTAARGLDVGDTIEPGHDANHEISSKEHVYFTNREFRAKKWSSEAAGGYKPGMRVFKVEPTGPYEHDANWPSDDYEASYQTKHPLRITGRVI
jgi:hypothetical protein